MSIGCFAGWGRALQFLFLIVCWNSLAAQRTIRVPADVRTIQNAIDDAKSGDTILVSPGVYNENLDFRGKAVTVTSGATDLTDPTVAATVINGSTDGPVIAFHTNEQALTTILNGFTVQNGHASAASALNGGGISISNASPTISNNIVQNNQGCGIFIYDGASPLIERNNIRGTRSGVSGGSTCVIGPHSLGVSAGVGIAIIQAGKVQVIGNTIENNVVQSSANGMTACGAGVSVAEGSQIILKDNIIRNNQASCNPGIAEVIGSPVESLILIQNLIYGNRSVRNETDFVEQVYLSGRFQAPYPTVTEINNTVYGGGQQLELGFVGSTISNNIFFNTMTNGRATGIPAAGVVCPDAETYPYPTLEHNDIFNLGSPLSGNCPLGSGNIAIDPAFVDSRNNDFHTLPNSPVVAAGDIKAPEIPLSDLDGKARTVDQTIDLGVYEVRPHPPIVLTATPNPAPGQSTVILAAQLTGNQKTPTGSVTFLDGSTVLGTGTIGPSGIAAFNTSFLFVGTHNLSATYAGDFNFEQSSSNVITELITGPPTKTVLNVVTPNPAKPLQGITMSASVTSNYTQPTGTVTFTSGTNVLATALIGSNGVATATVSTLRAGRYDIVAEYAGSTQYAASSSNVISEEVTAANTSVVLTASPNPAAPEEAVAFQAHVVGAQARIPMTGTIIFSEGANVLSSANLDANGVATAEYPKFLTGSHIITASYSGSQDYDASISAPLTITVTAIPTAIGLNISPNPAAINQNVRMTATVVSSLPGQVPTGTVTFSDQLGTLGTAPVVSGVASLSTTSLTAANHRILAKFNPTGLFASSISEVETETVNDFNFTIAASSKSLTLPRGDYQTIVVTITPSGGFPDSVRLSCDSVPDHAQCVFRPLLTEPLAKGPQTVQLTLNTSDVFGYGDQVGQDRTPQQEGILIVSAGVIVPFIGLLGLRKRFSQQLYTAFDRLLTAFVLLILGFGLQACTGKLPDETPPGKYTVVVTASDAGSATTLHHSINVDLTVK